MILQVTDTVRIEPSPLEDRKAPTRSPSAGTLALVLPVLVALGTVLRLVRYLAGNSLWGDEAALAVNLVARPWRALLQPLEYHQGAPLGFLLLERLSVAFFGSGEYALRLVPFLAGVASLVVFASLMKRLLAPPAAAMALLLFVLNDPLVFYSAQVKQYSLEVLVCLLIARLAVAVSERASCGRWAALSVIGVLGVWLSIAALFCAGAATVFLAWNGLRRKQVAEVLLSLAVLGATGFSFLLSFKLSVGTASTDGFILASWTHYFLPFPFRSMADIRWLPERMIDYFNDPGGIPLVWLALPLAGFGWLGEARRGRFLAVFVLAVFAGVLAASALRYYPIPTYGGLSIHDRPYPYRGRLLLFTVPFALALAAAGLDLAASLLGRWRWLAGVALAAVLAGPLAYQAAVNTLSPPRIHELRPVMLRIEPSIRNDDLFLVQRMSEPVFQYYVFRRGWRVRTATLGLRGPQDAAVVDSAIAAIGPGQRFWFVTLSHRDWGSPVELDALLPRIASRGVLVESAQDWNALAALFIAR